MQVRPGQLQTDSNLTCCYAADGACKQQVMSCHNNLQQLNGITSKQGDKVVLLHDAEKSLPGRCQETWG